MRCLAVVTQGENLFRWWQTMRRSVIAKTKGSLGLWKDQTLWRFHHRNSLAKSRSPSKQAQQYFLFHKVEFVYDISKEFQE